jgi:non-specific serine/threonine protein kinase
VLFECLAGVPAFPGSTPQARVRACLEREPVWALLPDDLPPSIREMLHACLVKDVTDRLSTIGEAGAAIHGAIASPAHAPVRGQVPHNVPAPLTRYIDREGEIERLLGLVRLARLVTITGPGGSGKTRLAVELARTLAAGRGEPSYPDGVVFVELAPLASGSVIPRAVLTALRTARVVTQQFPDVDIDVLVEHLADRSALLVLDNCEHLVDECAEFVGTLLHRCMNLRVLATSREALGVAGEQTYAVPELSVPPEAGESISSFEAVRLFADRARLARPGFEITASNQSAVAGICRRLDGIPLAIELAAARVASLPVDQIARRLFDVLDPKHVLESSIGWSIDQLAAPARAMLARLAVFRGGWTMEAAECVCADDDGAGGIDGEPIIELLSNLVRKSLARYVERDDRARYHMLETVREYCLAHFLDPDALRRLRTRHMEYYLDLATEADAAAVGADHAPWLERLETEHDNLRAALVTSHDPAVDPERTARLAVSLHRFWYVRGYVMEGIGALDVALERRASATDLLHAQTLNAAGILHGRHGDLDLASARCEEALAIVRGDARREGGVLTNLGLWAREAGDYARSRHFHEQAMGAYESIGDTTGVAMVRLNLGTVAKLEKRYEESRALLEQSLPIFQEVGDQQRIAVVLQNLGEVHYRQGDVDPALACLRESLMVTRALRELKVTAETLLWFGKIAQDQGSYDRSAKLYAAAEALLDAADAPHSSADTVDYESSLQLFRDRLGEQSAALAWEEGSAMTLEQATDFALEAAIDGSAT